jgi:hypothetical protein
MAEMQAGGQGDRGVQPTFGFTARGSGNFLLEEIVENSTENYNRGKLADDVPGRRYGSAQDAGGQFESCMQAESRAGPGAVARE